MTRGQALSRQPVRAAMIALCAFSVPSCPDDDPAEDAPRIDPARTAQGRLVAALNEILVLPDDGDETTAVAVLATRKWTDAVTAGPLLTHLAMRCGSSETPT